MRYAWEWGADVVMSVVHEAGGVTGIAAMYVATIGLAAWLWFRWQRTLKTDVLLACATAALLISSIQVHWLARPHMLSWVLLLVFAIVLERGGERFSWRDGLFFVGGTIVWAALHGRFLAGGQLAALYALGRWMMGEKERARWSLWAGVAIGAGSLVNPYGHRTGNFADGSVRRSHRRMGQSADASDPATVKARLDGNLRRCCRVGIHAVGEWHRQRLSAAQP